MRKHTILLVLCTFVLGGLIGCDKLDFFKSKNDGQKSTTATRVVTGTIIAQVGNVPITLKDLNQEIDFFNASVPEDKPEQKITTRDQKISYLKNELARRALLYQEALDRGLDKNYEIVDALEKAKMNLLVVELVKKETDNVSVSSQEIQEYYDTYKDQLKDPEERQIREIVVSTEQEARDIMIQLLQGADFVTLAKDKSKSSSAKNGGDIGFLSHGKKSAAFDAVAFSDTLEVGKTSNIFRGPDGYYILKLEAKRGGKTKPLSDMWDDIKRGLTFLKQQKKMEDLISKLSTQTKIEINESTIQ
ncbi:MAG: peptidyl-prolyl cis-trans isomerase [Candidatus Omnitrophica bacterium]|nr:peptidyl-prolyl cis-trans isomerase [Candidatus Omnitrophota bacterium]